ncbi:GntR family transcriptional regulator [Aporhodopirellula aestuarii]|uniref:GntR family transcriptional regulator n=1 Tax=Aporhodopirellula aestuarii TaxID=2950107 RepID=A0ABT0UA59_9BACT|nr:GntR family transcriptional regulator [Aporhodopirellula aestuarii]MCM2373837.1 GntR family transcriptional regulator [Aporhodopirellula aestuarii]
MSQEIHSVRAYQYLRNRLISGDFEPGTRLLYGPIGKEIGVSATPVREAAGRLANEGLVDLIPQIGAVVRTIGREELIEIYGVREIIEPGASAMAARKASEEQIAAIGEELAKMKAATEEQERGGTETTTREIKRNFDRADYGFHIRVFEATGNKAIVQTATQSQVLTRVFGIRKHIHDAESMKLTCGHHQAIYDGIANRQPEAAFAAAVEHIQYGLEHCLIVMDQAEAAKAAEEAAQNEDGNSSGQKNESATDTPSNVSSEATPDTTENESA